MLYRFGDSEIDGDGPELRRGGEPLELQPKVLDVLLLLARNSDRTLTREEIERAVWPGVAVTEASLTRCISIIRRELGNDVVKTRRGRGYRMGVRVEVLDAANPDSKAVVAPARRALLGRLSVAIAIAIATLLWLGRPFAAIDARLDNEAPALRAKAVAVLPFEVFGGLERGDDLPQIGHRISLEVIDRLGVAEELKIASPAASFALAGSPPVEIGRALGVGTLVLGSVRRGKGDVRVTVEIVEARSGLRVWSKLFDRDESELDGLPDQIAGHVARVLGASIEGGIEFVAASIESDRYYIQGRRAVLTSKRDHLVRAIELFERAIEIEQNEARTHVALAAAYERLWGLDEASAPWLDLAQSAISRAAAFAPGDPEILTVQATLQRNRRDWRGALQGYRAAISAGPSARAHEAMARLLCMLGRLDEALVHADRARELAPGLGSVHLTLARVSYYRGESGRALAHLEQALALDPWLSEIPALLARVYEQHGDEATANEAFLLVVAPWFRPVLRITDRILGTNASIRMVLFLDATREGVRCPTRGMGRALLWARLGETDRMYECIAAAMEKHPWYTAVEPGFASHRNEERFRQLLARHGLEVPTGDAP